MLREGERPWNSAKDLLPGEQGSIGLLFQGWSNKKQTCIVGYSKPGSLLVCICFYYPDIPKNLTSIQLKVLDFLLKFAALCQNQYTIELRGAPLKPFLHSNTVPIILHLSLSRISCLIPFMLFQEPIITKATAIGLWFLCHFLCDIHYYCCYCCCCCCFDIWSSL